MQVSRVTKYRGYAIELFDGPKPFLVHTYGIYGYYWFATDAEAHSFIDSLYAP